jgi:hypothetical protein
MQTVIVLMRNLSAEKDSPDVVKAKFEASQKGAVERICLFDDGNGERFAVVEFKPAVEARFAKVNLVESKDDSDNFDAYIPEPGRATGKPYLMPVEDVFTVMERKVF